MQQETYTLFAPVSSGKIFEEFSKQFSGIMELQESLDCLLGIK